MTEIFGNLIDGKWVSSASERTFDDENPALKGTVLARFQSSLPEDVDLAVAAAERAFVSWRRVDIGERIRLVERFLRRLSESEEELARIVSLENGKTIREARAEVRSAVAEGTHHARQAVAFSGATLPAGTNGVVGRLQYAPLGVVGIISPWNFPVNVMCRKTLPALLMGNTVVFKPATFTPWSGLFMGRLFTESGFPPGVFNAVTGPGAAVGDRIVNDPRIKALSFTGSTAVGRQIQQRAAANLTRTQLELGGKNALIVLADADLDAALDAAMTAGFACAGQWCTSTSRVLLQREIHDEFVARLVERCQRMVVGDPLDEKTDMGPVAGLKQFNDISAAVANARKTGARQATGGPAPRELADKGYFILPTVFTEVKRDSALFREEIFGPVLAVMPFGTLDEALELANDSAYGLSSSLFTNDLAAANEYIDRIEAGMAHVNIHTGFKLPALPFGGWKESGFGPPENGRNGLEFFVETKAVYIKSR
jgi:aldehyde dehydrogenase (NAD+)